MAHNRVMPFISEIRKGTEIGKNSTGYYIWAACEKCGSVRWTIYRQGNPPKLCQRCQRKLATEAAHTKKRIHGENNPHWKGGKRIRPDGYIEVKLQPDDFFYPMADKSGYVLEHRLVVAKSRQRCLLSWETVHHRDGIRNHNTDSNLTLFPAAYKHDITTRMGNYIKKLEAQIQKLKDENNVLKGTF